MTARNLLATTLVAALVSGVSAMPAAAQQATAPARALDIHTSMQRAVARAAAEQSMTKPRKVHANKQNSNGGSSSGGGHTGLIIGLVSAAAGIGATVYAVQQARKTENTLTATPQ